MQPLQQGQQVPEDLLQACSSTASAKVREAMQQVRGEKQAVQPLQQASATKAIMREALQQVRREEEALQSLQ
jgi:hypothetical protein